MQVSTADIIMQASAADTLFAREKTTEREGCKWPIAIPYPSTSHCRHNRYLPLMSVGVAVFLLQTGEDADEHSSSPSSVFVLMSVTVTLRLLRYWRRSFYDAYTDAISYSIQ